MRNTDSFFKDDTVETKKISLTPNLLREDSNGSMSANDTREVGYHYSKKKKTKTITLADPESRVVEALIPLINLYPTIS